jgi:hypothetical protein
MIGQSKENERLPGKWGILYMIFHGMIIKWLIYFYFQDFVKFGKECFDKSSFRNVTRMCKKLDTPPTQQPHAEPEPESKDEMCR